MTRVANAIAVTSLLLGLACIILYAPRANAAVEALVEPDDIRTHVIIECRPGQPCAQRGRAMGRVACELDAPGVAITAEKGTRVRCEKVKR